MPSEPTKSNDPANPFNPDGPREYHLPITNSSHTMVELLAEASGLSKQKIKQAMQKGAVWLTQGKQTKRVRRAKKTLHKGETLHLYYNESLLAKVPQPAELIHDQEHYSVWYKPSGMLCQGSKWSDHCTIGRWVEQHLEPARPAFIVHRLDRAASGLMLLAHSKTLANQLSQLFARREIEKYYRVKVYGEFASEPMTVDTPIDNKAACSHLQRLSFDANTGQSLLSVGIETGRKHQIRKHLAGLGFPVVGDRLYRQPGQVFTDSSPDLQLQAYSLRFTCPVTGEPRFFQLPEPYHLP